MINQSLRRLVCGSMFFTLLGICIFSSSQARSAEQIRTAEDAIKLSCDSDLGVEFYIESRNGDYFIKGSGKGLARSGPFIRTDAVLDTDGTYKLAPIQELPEEWVNFSELDNKVTVTNAGDSVLVLGTWEDKNIFILKEALKTRATFALQNHEQDILDRKSVV